MRLSWSRVACSRDEVSLEANGARAATGGASLGQAPSGEVEGGGAVPMESTLRSAVTVWGAVGAEKVIGVKGG